MQTAKTKRVAFIAAALFVLALCLHTGLEVHHSHIHDSLVEECAVCQHLQNTGRGSAGAPAPAAVFSMALVLVLAALLPAAGIICRRATLAALKVQLNN